MLALILAAAITVTPVSQWGLRVGGRPIRDGCAPAAIQAITQYWAGQRGSSLLKAQALVDANLAEGIGDGNGLSPNALIDDLGAAGYDAVPRYGSLDDLRVHLEGGPVLVVVRLGLRAAGPLHSVVVTAIGADRVYYVDSWTVRAQSVAVRRFLASWTGGYMTVQPRG